MIKKSFQFLQLSLNETKINSCDNLKITQTLLLIKRSLMKSALKKE